VHIKFLPDYIIYAKGLLTPATCFNIIDKFNRDPDQNAGELVIKPSATWRGLHSEIHRQVCAAIAQIVQKYKPLQVGPLAWTDYKIKRYEKSSGSFNWNFEALGPTAWQRQLTMLFYLNDVKAGGETCFLYQNIKVRPVAGDAIFFPPFWTHTHSDLTTETENKYIMTSYAGFAIPGVSTNAA